MKLKLLFKLSRKWTKLDTWVKKTIRKAVEKEKNRES